MQPFFRLMTMLPLFRCSASSQYANTLDRWICLAEAPVFPGGTCLKVRRLPRALAVRIPNNLLIPSMLARFAVKCAMKVLTSILSSPWISRPRSFYFSRANGSCLTNCSPRPVEVGTPCIPGADFPFAWERFHVSRTKLLMHWRHPEACPRPWTGTGSFPLQRLRRY